MPIFDPTTHAYALQVAHRSRLKALSSSTPPSRLPSTSSRDPFDSTQSSNYTTALTTPYAESSRSSPNVFRQTDENHEFDKAQLVETFENKEWLNIFFTTLRLDQDLINSNDFDRLIEAMVENMKLDWFRDLNSFHFKKPNSSAIKIIKGKDEKSILNRAYITLLFESVYSNPLIKILLVLLSQVGLPQKMQSFTNWCLAEKKLNIVGIEEQEFFITSLQNNHIEVTIKSIPRAVYFLNGTPTIVEASLNTHRPCIWIKLDICLSPLLKLECKKAEFRINPGKNYCATDFSNFQTRPINLNTLFSEFLKNITSTDGYLEYQQTNALLDANYGGIINFIHEIAFQAKLQ